MAMGRRGLSRTDSEVESESGELLVSGFEEDENRLRMEVEEQGLGVEFGEALRGAAPAKAGTIAGFLGVLCIGLAIALWTTSDRSFQCPDCNCGDPDEAALQRRHGSEETMGLGVAVFAAVLILCILLTFTMLWHHVKAFPDCIAYVLVGVFMGVIVRWTGGAHAAGYVLPNQDSLFLVVLPPIMFEAGYSLNGKDFFKQAGAITVFAFFGTIISTVVFSLCIYALGVIRLSYGFSLYEALAFGSLISAVDPVATIAVFNALKVNKTLHFLTFGESTLNDAVAIVLYRTCQAFIQSDTPPKWYIPLLSFAGIVGGSIVIGCLTAILLALILKHTQLWKYPTLELSMYFVFAYFPYFICEGLGLSGIMGILTGGLVMAHYAHYNLSRVSQLTSQQAFKMMAYLMETFVFVYLGVVLTTFRHHWHPLTITWSILLLFLSRAANVFPLSYLVNQWRSEKISQKNQFILWFSGLRGAIAFALSLSFSGVSEDTRGVVTSTTLLCVLFTVIVLGGGTLPLLRLLKVEGDVPSRNLEQDSTTPGLFQRIDDVYIRHLLVASRGGSISSEIALRQVIQSERHMTPHEMGDILASPGPVHDVGEEPQTVSSS